jgi:hypothetical protein
LHGAVVGRNLGQRLQLLQRRGSVAGGALRFGTRQQEGETSAFEWSIRPVRPRLTRTQQSQSQTVAQRRLVRLVGMTQFAAVGVDVSPVLSM